MKEYSDLNIFRQSRPRPDAISCFSGWRLLGILAIPLLAGCSVMTPVITSEEQEKLAKQDQELMFQGQSALSQPLTLHDAMARAIKYNLDFRLKRMEEVLSKNQAEISHLDMLPKLTLAAGYSDRSGNTASVSKSVNSGLLSTDPSISRESSVGNADLSMSWNFLDFGVSYYQARQEGNKQLIQVEQRRKAAQNLIKDVRFAFWKAAAFQWLEREMGAILKSSEEAMQIARKVENEGLRSPVQALQFQLGLLEIMRQLEKSRADLAVAKEELASLINLEPGVDYQLVDDSGEMDVTLPIGMPVENLELMALASRPELRIEQYQSRIEADETRKAMARLFPGLEFNISKSYDSNAFLVYQHWAQAGARLSWNLLRTLTGKQQLSLAERRESVIQMRRLVLQMAVLSQTRIAFHEYLASRNSLQSTITENQARRRLQDHTANRSTMGLDSQLLFVHTVAASALGRVRQYEAFARYQSALGRLYATLGLDPLDEGGLDQNLPHWARNLREQDRDWQNKIVSSSNSLPFMQAKSMTTPLAWSKVLPSEPPLQAVPPKVPVVDKISQNQTSVMHVSAWHPATPPPLAKQKKRVTASVQPRLEMRQPLQQRPQSVQKFEQKPVISQKTQFAVQVAATNDSFGTVDKLVAQLKAKGYQPYVNQIPGVDGTSVKQIWIGRYEKGVDAIAARDHYQLQEGKKAFIATINN